MTDEPRPDAPVTPEAEQQATPSDVALPETAGETTTAVTTPEEEAKPSNKLRQNVEIRDLGACKKHIKVTVEREDIDARFKDHYKKLVHDANVPGFRPGKAPRKLVERRYRKDVAEQVKTEVLMASLQQLGEDHDVAPLSQPELDPAEIDLPEQGPLIYEFEVETRPQFDLPPYRGLRLRRPVKNFTEDDVAESRRRLLAPQGQIVPKPEGNAQTGDVLVADIIIRDGQRPVGTIKEGQFRIEKQLAFKDGLVKKFAQQVKGVNPGDTRVVDLELSDAAADPDLAHKTVQAIFEIKEIKRLILPELTPEFLDQYGIQTAAQLDELILVLLHRDLEHQQRRWARSQVLQQIATSSWDLPRDLLQRQARRALNRRIMEMKGDGIPDAQIQQQRRLLEQNILETTALALKEHFVLQKIAEVEKIEVDDDDLNDEIERMAEQANESPRRLRARLEKEDMLDSLAAEMIERKALDLVLDTAEYEDVPLDEQEEEQPATASVEEQAVPGTMRDPSAPPPETPAETTPETTPEKAEASQ